MKTFYSGTLTLILVCVICLITNDWVYIYRLSGIIGVGTLVACGVTIGAFQSGGGSGFGGDSVSDVMSQTEEGQYTRIKWSTRFLLFGLPHVIAASFYIYFVFIKTT